MKYSPHDYQRYAAEFITATPFDLPPLLLTKTNVLFSELQGLPSNSSILRTGGSFSVLFGDEKYSILRFSLFLIPLLSGCKAHCSISIPKSGADR